MIIANNGYLAVRGEIPSIVNETYTAMMAVAEEISKRKGLSFTEALEKLITDCYKAAPKWEVGKGVTINENKLQDFIKDEPASGWCNLKRGDENDKG